MKIIQAIFAYLAAGCWAWIGIKSTWWQLELFDHIAVGIAMVLMVLEVLSIALRKTIEAIEGEGW